MSSEGELRFLGTIPYFRGLSRDELAHIGAWCHERELAGGEVLFLEGAPADALYVVRHGSVRVFKTSPLGKEQVLIVIGPGETFNDVPVFDGGLNPAGAQAVEPGAGVCVLPAARVHHLLATNPSVAANIVRVLAARLRHLTTLVEDLSFRTILHRLAKLLLEEAARSDGNVIVPQHELAARVGTAREVISRALRELEQHGAITRHRDHGVEVHGDVVRAMLERLGDPNS
jgi:CRP/FNR family transcriptional regulator